MNSRISTTYGQSAPLYQQRDSRSAQPGRYKEQMRALDSATRVSRTGRPNQLESRGLSQYHTRQQVVSPAIKKSPRLIIQFAREASPLHGAMCIIVTLLVFYGIALGYAVDRFIGRRNKVPSVHEFEEEYKGNLNWDEALQLIGQMWELHGYILSVGIFMLAMFCMLVYLVALIMYSAAAKGNLRMKLQEDRFEEKELEDNMVRRQEFAATERGGIRENM